MKLLEFDDYRSYVEAQKLTISHRGIGPYFSWLEIENVSNWLKERKADVKSAVCHGARNGLECDEFKKHFVGLDCFGTDLFPFSGKSINHRGKSDVIEWDFSIQRDEWIDKFDFVYSNSIDHARDPINTLNCWISQLNNTGVLFIQHTSTHESGTKDGDCFSCSLWELVDMCDSVGCVKDLIFSSIEFSSDLLQRRGLKTVVLAIQKRL